MEYRDKDVAVFGYSVEGRGVVEFLLQEQAKIQVFDEQQEEHFDAETLRKYRDRGVTFRFGPIPSLTKYAAIVRSPGISLRHPRLHEAQIATTPITSATKLFFDRCPCPIIGVTGTKGKGTTTTLIYEMLQTAGKDVYVGGNIGVVPLSFLSVLTPSSWVVLELSSFQLQDLTKSPHIAVVLMVTSEHQDYHQSVEEYIEAKANLVRHQTKDDIAVVCDDYEGSRAIAQQTAAQLYWYSRKHTEGTLHCFIDQDHIIWRNDKEEERILPVEQVALPGKHNWENTCAAVAAAKAVGIPTKNIQHVLETFPGLPHRLQCIAEKEGVRYYDDSFSTTPETTIAAIEAFPDPKILILGGSGKQSDFTTLGETIRSTPSIRAIIGIGDEWQRIKAALPAAGFQVRVMRYGGEYAIAHEMSNETHEIVVIEGCTTMREVILTSRMLAHKGDIVLLSPACASFGMFKNYKDRGEQFIQEVVG